MSRYTLGVAFLLLSSPVLAQQLQLPQGLNKAEYFGDVLAVVAFCNLTLSVDQYEMSAGMKAFGVTSSDQAGMEAVRAKYYEMYRREFTTPEKHQDFCTKIMNHPFIAKVKRRGVPTIAGSDDRRQSEKIEVFGEMFARMTFCKIQINAAKWGLFLSNMGVKSDSMPALSEHAAKTHNAISAKYNTPHFATDMCNETRASLDVQRLMGQ